MGRTNKSIGSSSSSSSTDIRVHLLLLLHFGWRFRKASWYYLWWNVIQDKNEYLCLKNMSISTKRSLCHGKALSLFTSKYVSFFIYFTWFYFISFEWDGISIPNRGYTECSLARNPIIIIISNHYHHHHHHRSRCRCRRARRIFCLFTRDIHNLFLYSASCVRCCVKQTHLY